MTDDLDLLAAWMAAMGQGDFARAWEMSDRALAQHRATGASRGRGRDEQWVWDGRPLEGRSVLVRCYHGLGDTLQFARFLPVLASRARELTVWAQPELIPLLATMSGVGRLLPRHAGRPEIEYEVDIEIMEIPHALRTTLETLPAEVPYFTVPAAPRLSKRFSVGVVAEAGEWDPGRSVPLELFASLGSLPGLDFFNLQPGIAIPGAHDASAPDVLVAAARVQALDLVITVDTMMAHLAGALAAPTWTLLRAEADWRWMEARADSPWYPTMRLFRQPQPGAWEPVIEHVCEELVRLALPAA